MNTKTNDIVGVGFGPANIALAICLEELAPTLSHTYLEAQYTPSWQDQMLLDGSDIQNNPLRDFVTPRNPQSHYTFINYLKETGRLFEYLNLPAHYPLRREFAAYIEWAASHFLARVRMNTRSVGIECRSTRAGQHWVLHGSDGSVTEAKCLVIGTGRTANIPKQLQPHLGKKVFHLTEYRKRIEALPASAKRIGVLGASQSAVEILLDLMSRFSDRDIYSIQRGFGFRLKDVSPFSDRVYFPEFIDYFYKLSPEGRRNIQRQLRGTNYSSADGDVINSLYMRMHEERLAGKQRLHIVNNTEVRHAKLNDTGLGLDLWEVNTGEAGELELDALVLATGFKDLSGADDGESCPPVLKSVAHLLKYGDNGVVEVARDYRLRTIDPHLPPIYLNGLCEATHGFGDAGSFSLLSIRSETLVHSIKGHLSLGDSQRAARDDAAAAVA